MTRRYRACLIVAFAALALLAVPLAVRAQPPGRVARVGLLSEPLAVALSKKAKGPVKMVMSREDVLKPSGPTSGANVRVKMGVTKDGKFVAGFVELKYQAGAFPGSPVQPGVMCANAPYDIENVKVIGCDVVSNRPRRAAPLVARAEEAPAT